MTKCKWCGDPSCYVKIQQNKNINNSNIYEVFLLHVGLEVFFMLLTHSFLPQQFYQQYHSHFINKKSEIEIKELP